MRRLVPLLFVLTLGCATFGHGGTQVNSYPLAACLKEKGVKLYEAPWCEACADQKRLFGGNAVQLLTVECENADGTTVNSECNRLLIENYPTWILPDGTQLIGARSLEDLAAETQCPLK